MRFPAALMVRVKNLGCPLLPEDRELSLKLCLWHSSDGKGAAVYRVGVNEILIIS